MEIRLSDETLTGLRRLCNRSLMKEDFFQRLITECLNNAQTSADNEKREINEFKSDVLKTAYAALTILLTEAAKHDLDTFKLTTLLKGYNLDYTRIEPIVDAYENRKDFIRTRLSAIGTNLSHIVDIHWRIDFKIKSDYLGERIIQPYITVELVTVTSSRTKKIVKFVCTLQSLQELIFSLRGAARHLTKMVNPSKEN